MLTAFFDDLPHFIGAHAVVFYIPAYGVVNIKRLIDQLAEQLKACFDDLPHLVGAQPIVHFVSAYRVVNIKRLIA